MGQGKAGKDPIQLFFKQIVNNNISERDPIIGYYSYSPDEFYKITGVTNSFWCIDNPQELEGARQGKFGGEYHVDITTGKTMYKKMKKNIVRILSSKECHTLVCCNDSTRPDKYCPVKDMCYYGLTKRKLGISPLTCNSGEFLITDEYIPSGKDWDVLKQVILLEIK